MEFSHFEMHNLHRDQNKATCVMIHLRQAVARTQVQYLFKKHTPRSDKNDVA